MPKDISFLRAGRKYYVTLFCLSIIYLLSRFLYGSPQDLDTYFSWKKIIGLLGYFLFFSFCLLGWGLFLTKWIRLTKSLLVSAIPLGALTLIGLGYVYVNFGFIELDGKLHIVIPLLLGPIACFNQNPGAYWNCFVEARWKIHRYMYSLGPYSGLPARLLILALLLMGVGALLPQTDNPALINSLTAPRLWFESGDHTLTSSIPGIYTTGLWQYLYVWPLLFVGATNGQGMLAAEIFSQLIHFCLGFLPTVLFLLILFRRFAGARFSICLTIIALSSVAIVEQARFAVDDFGVILFLGAALLPASQTRRVLQPLEIFFVGMLLGAAIASKLGLYWLVGSMSLIWLVRLAAQKRLQVIPLLALGAILPLTPILLRNYEITANPYFPHFISLFPESLYSETWKEYYLQSVQIDWQSILQRLLLGLQENPASLVTILSTFLFTLFLVVLPKDAFSNVAKQRMLQGPLLWSYVALISLALYLLGASTNQSTADLSLLLLLLPGLGFCILILYLKFLHTPTPLFIWILILVMLPIAYRGPLFRTADIIQFSKRIPYHEQIRTSDAGRALAWTRLNAPRSNGIGFLQFDQIYFLAHRPIIRIFDDAALDSKLRAIKTPQEAVLALLDRGIHYLIYDENSLDKFINEPVRDLFVMLANIYPDTIAFESEKVWVMDIRQLKLLLDSADFEPVQN